VIDKRQWEWPIFERVGAIVLEVLDLQLQGTSKKKKRCTCVEKGGQEMNSRNGLLPPDHW
jgi:hypothetical protein